MDLIRLIYGLIIIRVVQENVQPIEGIRVENYYKN